MSIISCTSLLFTNSAYRHGIKIKDNPSKTVIESTENGYVQDSKESANDEGTEEKIKSPPLQKLPFYDTNPPTVISPLSKKDAYF